jgi:molecular chaperone HtpG
MLDKLAKDDAEKYQTFWKQFGLVLKRRSEQPGSDRQTAALRDHPYRLLRADRVAGRVRLGMKEGGEDLLHHCRQLCGGEEQPAPRAAA